MIFQNKRVLITGAGGFVGKQLCRDLHFRSATVLACDRNESCVNESYQQFVIDLCDKSSLHRLVSDAKPHIIVHLAADKCRSTRIGDYRKSYDVNLLGTMSLLEVCQGIKELETFLFFGSCEEYGIQKDPFNESMRESPVTAYGVTKLAVTHLLQAFFRAFKFPAIILRPSVIYGPGQGTEMFIPSLVKSLLIGENFSMSSGQQTRDFVYVDDVVDVVISALSVKKIKGSIINVGSGNSVCIKDVAVMLANLIGPDMDKKLIISNEGYRQGEAMSYCVDARLAEKELGWYATTSLDVGCKKTVDYYRTQLKNALGTHE